MRFLSLLTKGKGDNGNDKDGKGKGDDKACTLVAKGHGVDDAPHFLSASQACSKVTIPAHTTLNISTRLNQTNLHNKHIDLQGTIRFNPDIPYWSGNGFSFPFQTQITFWILGGKNILLDGGGTLDGAGQDWYDAFAANSSLLRPITMTIFQATNVLWFNLVNEGTNVTYDNLRINAVSNSTHRPSNTDGWDIYRSDQPNATNIIVSNLNCNWFPTQPVFLRSLGQFAGMFDIVENVTATNVIMSNAQNGARIKEHNNDNRSRRGPVPGVGSGIVKNITFDMFFETNVDNPVVIDQCYMTNATACAQFPSNTFIQDVLFTHISGTSSGATVASLACSPDGRCSNIDVENFNLSSPTGPAQFTCQNVNLTGNAAGLFPACTVT
ncbi:pectin lyase fold/virulence factor [Mycena filopes]|nr:pectin lyase fold/virulence factor [Mycena filopes]